MEARTAGAAMVDSMLVYLAETLVRCKATGRVMTVDEVYPRQFAYRYRCVWLEDGQPRSELFKLYEIEAADE